MPRLNHTQAREAIAERKPFVNNTGSLRGLCGKKNDVGKTHLTGWLNNTERQEFLASGNMGIEYLVVSYGTPIAWFITNYGWYSARQNFSPTTTRHQNLLPVPPPYRN